MRDRYAAHRPIQELAVHCGLDEDARTAREGRELLWLGRIDAEKAPHLAIQAARLLGRDITIAGPIFDYRYVDACREWLHADHVSLTGEVGGPRKSQLLADASVLVYSCGRGYVEAGAATFGEALRAGTPVAALAWRPGTCAQAALCNETGAVAQVEPEVDDEIAARELAGAIEGASVLRAADVQEIGLARFHPARHFEALGARPC